MIVDRRALILGSWLAKGRDKPSPQRVRSILDRWTRIFAEDRYGFRSLVNREDKPTPLQNPSVADVVNQLDSSVDVTDQTELLIYFVGHSVSEGENDIRLILSLDPKGEDRSASLSWLLDTIHKQTSIRKIIAILDTCHAGRTHGAFRNIQRNSFAMFGTGDAYAFDANFSDGVLRALEHPTRKNDQRIDRRAGGVTYQKIFEEARRRVLSGVGISGAEQDPQCFGDYGGVVLLEAPVLIPGAFNDFASSRSIYGRLYRLLELVKDRHLTLRSLQSAIRRDPIFLLRHEDDGQDRFVSSERLSEYLDFLRAAKWAVQPGGRFQLTAAGQNALDIKTFNQSLLHAIERDVFSDNINFKFIDEVVKDLLVDMIPPTPIRIKERAAMKGKIFDLNIPTRVALQLLPSTGMFLKGAADAIFPSEVGG